MLLSESMSFPERTLPCPSCDGMAFRPTLAVPDAPDSGNALVRCRGCGLVVVARAPSSQDLLDYYWEHSYGSGDAWKIMPATEASLASLAARLKPFHSTGRLLDIGCGSGVLLSVM